MDSVGENRFYDNQVQSCWCGNNNVYVGIYYESARFFPHFQGMTNFVSKFWFWFSVISHPKATNRWLAAAPVPRVFFKIKSTHTSVYFFFRISIKLQAVPIIERTLNIRIFITVICSFSSIRINQKFLSLCVDPELQLRWKQGVLWKVQINVYFQFFAFSQLGPMNSSKWK